VTWLTLGELAVYLKTSKTTLRRLSHQGILPTHRLGRRLLFDQDEVDSAVKQGASASAAPSASPDAASPSPTTRLAVIHRHSPDSQPF